MNANLVQQICQRTNHSWGFDVLLIEHNRVHISNTFHDMFQSALAKPLQSECLCIYLGIDENDVCRSKIQFDPSQIPGLQFYIFDSISNQILML